jgi:hypothetical protein
MNLKSPILMIISKKYPIYSINKLIPYGEYILDIIDMYILDIIVNIDKISSSCGKKKQVTF